MPEFFKNITDSAKFIMMLLIYTGYMTWWASGVSHDLSTTIGKVALHVISEDHPIAQTQAIIGLSKIQEKQTKVLEITVVQHAKCVAALEAMVRRIESLEGR